MRPVDFHQAHGRAPAVGVEPSDVAQHLSARPRRFESLAHGGVDFGHAGEEFLRRRRTERLGHQSLELDVREFQVEAHLARQDDQLARDVGP